MLSIILEFFRHICALVGMVGVKNNFPPALTKEEETVLITRLEAGDIGARNELIERNLRLVAHISKKYAGRGRDTDDLISIGTVGLIKAIGTFKAEKGRTIAAYAARCIENEILMSIRAERKQRGEVPFGEPIGVDRDGNEITLADVLSSDEDVSAEVESREESKLLHIAVNEALTPREKQVITMRYGINGSKIYPQREVGQLLGISRSYVSRIEKKALKKLNAYLVQEGS